MFLLVVVRAVITLRRVNSDLFISIDSFYIFPSALPVKLYLSEPAKSTICSFDIILLCGLLTCTYSTMTLKIV
jgi:hypothetical protein